MKRTNLLLISTILVVASVSGLDITDPENTRYMYLDEPQLKTFNNFGIELETYFNLNKNKFPVQDILFKGHPKLNWYSFTIDQREGNRLCFEIDNNGQDRTLCHAEELQGRKWYNLSFYLHEGQVIIGINDSFTTYSYDPKDFLAEEPLYFGKCIYAHDYMEYCYNYRGVFKSIKVYNNGYQWNYEDSFKYTPPTTQQELPEIKIENKVDNDKWPYYGLGLVGFLFIIAIYLIQVKKHP